MAKTIEILNPSNPAEIKALIQDPEYHSLGYTGTNIDGDFVLVSIHGNGATIKTNHKSKPRWLECVHYDANGYQECVTYEPFDD